jgi:O-antigen/teichoic acid export membrane protein
LGHTLASHSINVFKILSLGVFFNATATLPFFLLQGAGRPDLPAKFHFVELFIFGILLYFFIPKFGIEGAAISWSLRSLIDAFLLFGSTHKLFPYLYIRSKVYQIFGLIIFSFFLIALILILDKYFYDVYLHYIISTTSLLLFVVIGWKWFLQINEQTLLLSLLGIKTKNA